MVGLLAHWLGLDNASGPPYLWWSGAGADLGELAIIGGLVSIYRRHNCEVHRCWRLGRHATAAGHMVCRRHHPLDRLTSADVVSAHEEAGRS
ncbi:hypothetical protein [Streptacidiphilus sp. EB129]|jgi:hypothetical protein|uniref:hypothetical protein n=1 Tax=Streptacidiphilus sp. EB129 TaxID=3156262 RepID=UPI0035175B38